MMNDTEARLIKCFSAVFPQLGEQAIPSAILETVEGWDSVATITLVTVIEEEFGVQFEPDALEHFVSFGSILDYLKELPAVQ
ncbi:MAG: acyl carrier protein [Terriglobia bacterium]